MLKLLRNKKILITAGPTWVPIDRVRIIANVSSGRTGLAIAQYAAEAGADVTLLLGPVDAVVSRRFSVVRPLPVRRSLGVGGTIDQRLKVIRFKYFDELLNLMEAELRRKKYDIIIHGAAVSDYRPVKNFLKKIKSGKRQFAITLKPTAKIVDKIKQYAKGVFLVMFKLEVKAPKNRLVDIAYRNMLRSKADLIVANNIDEISENRHKAYIVDLQKNAVKVETKEELAKRLLTEISKRL